MLAKIVGKWKSAIWFFVFMAAYFTFDRWLKHQVVGSEMYDSIDVVRSECNQELKGEGLYSLFKLREASSRETVTRSGGSGVIKYWISSVPTDTYPVSQYCEVKHVDGVITSIVWQAGSHVGRVIDPR